MLYICRLAHFVKKGDSWTLNTSAFANLSHIFREPFADLPHQIPKTNTCTCLRVSFRGFRGALLLSRAFANQHFPFAQAPQINLHIKVNVGGFLRSSIGHAPKKGSADLSIFFLSSPRWEPLAYVYTNKTHTWILVGLCRPHDLFQWVLHLGSWSPIQHPPQRLLQIIPTCLIDALVRIDWAVAGSSHHAVPAALTDMSPDQLAVPWVLPPLKGLFADGCSGISWLISAQ